MCTKINILSNEHQIFKYKNTNVIILQINDLKLIVWTFEILTFELLS